MLKDPDSVYKPNVRTKGGWIKVKPEYSGSLMDQCDLIVMGGYYGSGRRGGLVRDSSSQYLSGWTEVAMYRFVNFFPRSPTSSSAWPSPRPLPTTAPPPIPTSPPPTPYRESSAPSAASGPATATVSCSTFFAASSLTSRSSPLARGRSLRWRRRAGTGCPSPGRGPMCG